MQTPLRHICESCGVDVVLTPEEAFEAGWDYPPHFFGFRVLSPRTCGNCTIDTTLWWRCVTQGQSASLEDLPEKDKALLLRIAEEPESILPTKE